MTVVLFNSAIPVWQLLLTCGIALVVLEAFAPGFVLLPAGLAFLTAAVTSTLFDNWALQFINLALHVFAMFLLFRNFINPNMKEYEYKTGVDAMVGKEVQVVEAIRSGSNGYVKLYGDRWEAIGLDGAEFAPGDVAVIEKLDGNKVIVRRMD